MAALRENCHAAQAQQLEPRQAAKWVAQQMAKRRKTPPRRAENLQDLDNATRVLTETT